MFDNLKIAITDEVQLKAVCDVLESMGYDKPFQVFDDKDIETVECYDDGSLAKYGCDLGDNGKTVTLTDLLAIRDKQFMEKINLAELKEMQ